MATESNGHCDEEDPADAPGEHSAQTEPRGAEAHSQHSHVIDYEQIMPTLKPVARLEIIV